MKSIGKEEAEEYSLDSIQGKLFLSKIIAFQFILDILRGIIPIFTLKHLLGNPAGLVKNFKSPSDFLDFEKLFCATLNKWLMQTFE